MRSIAGFSIFVAAVLLGSPACVRADSIVWGPAVGGMRLGIDFAPASTSGPVVRVSLQNAGPAAQDLILGYGVGKATAYNLTFLAAAPDGKLHKGFDAAAFIPVAGLVLPVLVHLESGATREFPFPLHNIICIEKPGDIRMDTLVKQGNSLRAVFEGSRGMSLSTQPAAPRLWTGKLTSGELAPKN
ncbi:MAG: hypothetical protein ACRD9L_17550 [Bryobacteraceae bacterium]